MNKPAPARRAVIKNGQIVGWEEISQPTKKRELPVVPEPPKKAEVVSVEQTGTTTAHHSNYAEYCARKDRDFRFNPRDWPTGTATVVCPVGHTWQEDWDESKTDRPKIGDKRECPGCLAKFRAEKSASDAETVRLYADIVSKIRSAGFVDNGEGLRDCDADLAWAVRQVVKAGGRVDVLENMYE